MDSSPVSSARARASRMLLAGRSWSADCKQRNSPSDRLPPPYPRLPCSDKYLADRQKLFCANLRRRRKNARPQGHVVAVFLTDGFIGPAYGSSTSAGISTERMAACTITERLRSWSIPSGDVAKPSTILLIKVRNLVCDCSPSALAASWLCLPNWRTNFLQEIGILIYFRIVPVNATILFIHHRAHYTAIDLGFIQQTMKGQRRDRTKMRRLNALNLADQAVL